MKCICLRRWLLQNLRNIKFLTDGRIGGLSMPDIGGSWTGQKKDLMLKLWGAKKTALSTTCYQRSCIFFAKWTHKVNLIDNRKYADKGQIMYVGLAFWHLSKKCFVIFWWFWKPLMGNTWPRTLPHETSWPQYHASFSFFLKLTYN